MTVYAVYLPGGHDLVCRTRDRALAERVKASVAGRIETIERELTVGELMAAEQRLAAA